MLSALANKDTPTLFPDDPFLKRFSLLELPGIGHQAVVCEFAAAHYRPDLFDRFQVAMPASLAGAQLARCAEYLAGRCAARMALLLAGQPAVAPGRGATGEGLWPPGCRGAISHHRDHALCVVSAQGLPGIDIEGWMSPAVCREVAGLVGNSAERRMFAEQGVPDAEAVTLLFSTKESLYKALFPLLQHYVDFLDVGLRRLIPERQCLELELLRCQHAALRGQRFTVHWRRCERAVISYLCASPG